MKGGRRGEREREREREREEGKRKRGNRKIDVREERE